jgi:hypothetical protein
MRQVTELDRLRGNVVSEITLECGIKIQSAFFYNTELRACWCPIHKKTEKVITFKREVLLLGG